MYMTEQVILLKDQLQELPYTEKKMLLVELERLIFEEWKSIYEVKNDVRKQKLTIIKEKIINEGLKENE